MQENCLSGLVLLSQGKSVDSTVRCLRILLASFIIPLRINVVQPLQPVYTVLISVAVSMPLENSIVKIMA